VVKIPEPITSPIIIMVIKNFFQGNLKDDLFSKGCQSGSIRGVFFGESVFLTL
jgi:hypothetical protein